VSRRIAVVAGALAFVAVALVVARWLQADNAERAKVQRLLEAQARGDAAAMARELERCDATCRGRMAALSASIRGSGDIEIVRYDSRTSHALGSQTGPTRVVWQRRGILPTVQCVTVRRRGGALTGPRVTLTALSAPVARDAGC
jgi:hypothetical protein